MRSVIKAKEKKEKQEYSFFRSCRVLALLTKNDFIYYIEQRIKECVLEIERANLKLVVYRDILTEFEGPNEKY